MADWEKFGNRRMIPTGESIVFFEQGRKCLHKDEISIFQGSFRTISSGGYYLRASDTQHVISWYQYRFIGISEDIKGIRIVLQQKNISSMFRVPTPKMIDDYLRNELGLTKEGKYFYGNEYLAITDISNLSDNVLCDEMESYFSLIPSSD